MKKILINFALVGIIILTFSFSMSANAMSPSASSLPPASSNTNTFTTQDNNTSSVANVVDNNMIAADIDQVEQVPVEVMIAADIDEDSLIFKAPNTGDYTMYFGMAAVVLLGAMVITGRKIKN